MRRFARYREGIQTGCLYVCIIVLSATPRYHEHRKGKAAHLNETNKEVLSPAYHTLLPDRKEESKTGDGVLP